MLVGMSPFLTLVACIHIVAGTSCPEADEPAESIAMVIKSPKEATSILLCDTVSLDKGNEIKNMWQVSKSYTVLIGYYDYHLMTLSFACFISFQREKRELEII